MSEDVNVIEPLPDANPQSVTEPARGGPRFVRWALDVAETVLPALLIVLVVNVFLAQATRVEGQSMEPNIHDDQRLVVEKVSYRVRPPQRGEIVVIKSPSWRPQSLQQQILTWFCTIVPVECSVDMPDPLIKRVVGLPGETIEIRDGQVCINGPVLEEPYVEQLTFGDVSPRVISPDHVFVLGDNRGASNDSRSFGEVALSNIVGRAWLRYWPPEDMGVIR
jgi:signal peptidase I